MGASRRKRTTTWGEHMSIGWMAGLRRSLGVCLVAGVAVLGFAGANAQAKVAANCVPPINLEAPEQNLSYCDLNGAAIFAVDALARSNLTGAKLKGVTFGADGQLDEANVTRANLTGVVAYGGLRVLERSTAVGVVLNKAQFYNRGFLFDEADMVGAKLNGAIIEGYADLAEANLTGASLKYAQLGVRGEPYVGARANFTGANLSRATIEGDELALQEANLTGANLQGAKVTGELFNVTYSNTRCPDGTNSDNDGGTCVGHGVP
jgi:uncharacterized protein YjbI with pentapeptide repeats